jgi:hypothetical protein
MANGCREFAVCVVLLSCAARCAPVLIPTPKLPQTAQAQFSVAAQLPEDSAFVYVQLVGKEHCEMLWTSLECLSAGRLAVERDCCIVRTPMHDADQRR